MEGVISNSPDDSSTFLTVLLRPYALTPPCAVNSMVYVNSSLHMAYRYVRKKDLQEYVQKLLFSVHRECYSLGQSPWHMSFLWESVWEIEILHRSKASNRVKLSSYTGAYGIECLNYCIEMSKIDHYHKVFTIICSKSLWDFSENFDNCLSMLENYLLWFCVSKVVICALVSRWTSALSLLVPVWTLSLH